eukprot:6389460-Pyramimonas_sp.AAC.1
MSGGLWTQSKLYEERYSLSSACWWCRHPSGSISHRLYGCDGLEAWRRDQGYDDVVSVGREIPGNCLVDFGVTDSMRAAMPPPLQDHECPQR